MPFFRFYTFESCGQFSTKSWILWTLERFIARLNNTLLCLIHDIYKRVFNTVLEWIATYFPLHSIDGLVSVMKSNVNYAPLTWGRLINNYQTIRLHIPEPSTHHTAVRASNPEYTMLVFCKRGTETLSIVKMLKFSLSGVSKFRHIASISVKISKLKPKTVTE